MTREEIIKLKEERGYSVAKLSEYSGVPVGTIRKIITGESKNPRMATLNALEKVLVGDETIYSGKSYEYDTQSVISYANEDSGEYIAGNTVFKDKSFAEDNHVKDQGEYTVEDYMNLKDGDRKELIDGVFYDMASPTMIHQDIVSYLIYKFRNFINENKGKCKAIVAPSAVQIDCDERTMLEPDIYIICNRDNMKRFGIYGAPDFVLEVLSESTRKKDLGVKICKYINGGVKEIWYIDIKTEKIITYFKDDDYIPVIHSLEETVGLSIYEGKLQIDLSEIRMMIKEYSNLSVE